MGKSRLFTSQIMLLVLLGFAIAGMAYADEESLGRAAEQEGKLRQALTHYVEALTIDATNQPLRVKIIKLAQKIQPSPELPEEAERYLARGEAAVEIAQDDQGFKLAADEFSSALQIAPWFADIYFNLGVVLDKAGNYDEAIGNLNFYLIAVPHDKDAKKLKYKIEYRQDIALKEKVHAQENNLHPMSGHWSSSRWYKIAVSPSIGGKYWTSPDSKYGGAEVRINGETFHAVLKNTISATYIFKGHILGSAVNGTVIQKEQKSRCPAYPARPFKGSILTKDMIIWLSFKGEYVGGVSGCSLDSWDNSYLTSFRFTR